MIKPQLNSVLLHDHSQCGTDISKWLSSIGGKGLETALQRPSSIIPEIKAAKLRGLGGSGFPTYKKWLLLSKQHNNNNRYLICNGNEDEPGTFKDRSLLENTPHQIIEGALICALATNINHIIFYINPDQKKSLDNIRACIAQWLASDYLPKIENTLGRSLHFRVMASSGEYIGGEETAAIEAVENKFPFPRGKPPFPVQHGVHFQPTLVNNIETLANVPHIMRNGAQWFNKLGKGNASGTKLYCLSGDVNSPGVYELPMGTSLNELIVKYGNGICGKQKLKAIFTGGPSNSILTEQDLQMALDFDSVALHHSSLGTGAMIIVAEGNSIVKHIAKYILFFSKASCGQCPPCTTGIRYLSELLTKIETGHGNREDLDILTGLCNILPYSGRCHLPNGAINLLKSALRHFQGEFENALRSTTE